MKVLIEIDLLDGQKIPDASDILRLTSSDWLCDFWHIDDVKECLDYDITDDDARKVLELVENLRDCNEGINWHFIQFCADRILRRSNNGKGINNEF